MTEPCKTHEVRLNKPEPVSDAELDILIYVKLCWLRAFPSFVNIQKIFVDIEKIQKFISG